MKIDLTGGDYHIHTTYSDGLYTPEEIVLWAKQRGLKEIAITDHDGVDGIKEAQTMGKKVGLNVIPGIEFSTEMGKSVELHILGYGIDIANTELRDKCRWMLEKREERNKKLISALREEGVDISFEELYEKKQGGTSKSSFLGKPDIARLMVEKGYAKNKDDVFAIYFTRSPYKEIRKAKIDTLEALKIIQDAGGEAVLAHPGLIKRIGVRKSEGFHENFEQILDTLVDSGLSGLECHYPKHSEEEVKYFISQSVKRGLIATKGSDFHGD